MPVMRKQGLIDQNNKQIVIYSLKQMCTADACEAQCHACQRLPVQWLRVCTRGCCGE